MDDNKKKIEINKALTDALIHVFVSPSNEIDKFSSWLQVSSGAAIVLIISNIESVSKIIELNISKTIIILLGISILFGVTQKYFSLFIKIEQLVFKELDEKVNSIAEKYSDEPVDNPYTYLLKNADVINARSDFISSFPSWAKTKFIKILAKDKKHHDSKIERFVLQLCLFTLQIAVLLIAIGVSAFGL